MRRPRGFTFVEVLVAIVILATAAVALERLAARSVAQLTTTADISRAMLLAQSVLADACVEPPQPGWTGMDRNGLHVEREVRRTAHPALREVHVRVATPGGDSCELVEVIRVPPA